MSDPAADPSTFVVDLDGFEGPLDLLLELARAQKVDLARISILALAEQFLAYLRRVQARQLQIAAEYLVMAAWLAYLKSQLLLPPAEREMEDAEAAAEDLTDRLRRLEALRLAAEMLQARPQLGVARFARGLPEPVEVTVTPLWRAGLGELFVAYGQVMRRGKPLRMTMPARRLVSVEAALQRLSQLLTGHDWRELRTFLPEDLGEPLLRRSAIASGLIASLELAKQGQIELQQTAPFGPIMIRRRSS
ncbi:segregation and condensation protein A [Benzoatithermus flavus]|uniref:Segregation and condensation protein A n=1 Tax=Benzoatithermus flavus TaxID=3108223 RepID=A0ABU8XW11_9PROT